MPSDPKHVSNSPQSGVRSTPVLVPQGALAGQPDVPLNRPITTIGSGEESRLHLTSRTISRSHAILVNSNGGTYVADLASRTGVEVNGQRVRDVDLKAGDRLQIGKFVFRFRPPAGGQPAAPTPPPAASVIVVGQPPVPITGRAVLIGRRENSDILLPSDSGVSAAHAVIFELDGQWTIRDLGSRTGTMVNAAGVVQQTIKFGDRISIGNSTLLVQPAAIRKAVEPEPPVALEESAVGFALAEEVTPAEIPAEIDDAIPLEEPATVEEPTSEVSSPVEDVAAEEVTPIEASLAVEEPAAVADDVQEMTPAQEPVEDHAPVEFAAVAKEVEPAEAPVEWVEASPVVEEQVAVEEQVLVEESAPVEEPAAVQEPAPVEVSAPIEEFTPAEALAPVEPESIQEIRPEDSEVAEPTELPVPLATVNEPSAAEPAPVNTAPPPPASPVVLDDVDDFVFDPTAPVDDAADLLFWGDDELDAATEAVVIGATPPPAASPPAATPRPVDDGSTGRPTPDAVEPTAVTEPPRVGTPASEVDAVDVGPAAATLESSPSDHPAAIEDPAPPTDSHTTDRSATVVESTDFIEGLTHADETDYVATIDAVGDVATPDPFAVGTPIGSEETDAPPLAASHAPDAAPPDIQPDPSATVVESTDFVEGLTHADETDYVATTDAAGDLATPDPFAVETPIASEETDAPPLGASHPPDAAPPDVQPDPLATVVESTELAEGGLTPAAPIDEVAPYADKIVSYADEVVPYADEVALSADEVAAPPIDLVATDEVSDLTDVDAGPTVEPMHASASTLATPHAPESVTPFESSAVDPIDDADGLAGPMTEPVDAEAWTGEPIPLIDLIAPDEVGGLEDLDAGPTIEPMRASASTLVSPPIIPPVYGDEFMTAAAAIVETGHAISPPLGGGDGDSPAGAETPQHEPVIDDADGASSADELQAWAASFLSTEHVEPAEDSAAVDETHVDLDAVGAVSHDVSAVLPDVEPAMTSSDVAVESRTDGSEPPHSGALMEHVQGVDSDSLDELTDLDLVATDEWGDGTDGGPTVEHAHASAATLSVAPADGVATISVAGPTDLEEPATEAGDLAPVQTTPTLADLSAVGDVGDQAFDIEDPESWTAETAAASDDGESTLDELSAVGDVGDQVFDPHDTHAAVDVPELEPTDLDTADDTTTAVATIETELPSEIEPPAIGDLGADLSPPGTSGEATVNVDTVDVAETGSTTVTTPADESGLESADESGLESADESGLETADESGLELTEPPAAVQPTSPAAPVRNGPSLFGFGFDGDSFIGGLPLALPKPDVPNPAAVSSVVTPPAVVTAPTVVRPAEPPAVPPPQVKAFDPTQTKPSGLTSMLAPPPPVRRPPTPQPSIRPPSGLVGLESLTPEIPPTIPTISPKGRPRTTEFTTATGRPRTAEVFSQVDAPIGVEAFSGLPNRAEEIPDIGSPAAVDRGPSAAEPPVAVRKPLPVGMVVFLAVLLLVAPAGWYYGLARFIPVTSTVKGTIRFDNLAAQPMLQQKQFRTDQMTLIHQDDLRADAQIRLEKQGVPAGFTSSLTGFAEVVDAPGALTVTGDELTLRCEAPDADAGKKQVDAVLRILSVKNQKLNDDRKTVDASIRQAVADRQSADRQVKDIRAKRRALSDQVQSQKPSVSAVAEYDMQAAQARKLVAEADAMVQAKQKLLDDAVKQDATRAPNPDTDPQVLQLRREIEQLQAQVDSARTAKGPKDNAILALQQDRVVDLQRQLDERLSEIKQDAALTPADRDRLRQINIRTLTTQLDGFRQTLARARELSAAAERKFADADARLKAGREADAAVEAMQRQQSEAESTLKDAAARESELREKRSQMYAVADGDPVVTADGPVNNTRPVAQAAGSVVIGLVLLTMLIGQIFRRPYIVPVVRPAAIRPTRAAWPRPAALAEPSGSAAGS